MVVALTATKVPPGRLFLLSLKETTINCTTTMKQIVKTVSLLAVAAMTVLSCAKTEQDKYTFTHRVIINAGAVKTSIVESNNQASFLWSSDDASRFYIKENETEGNNIVLSSFDEYVTMTLGADFTVTSAASYTYTAYLAKNRTSSKEPKIPAAQTSTATSFDPNADVLVAKSQTFDDAQSSLSMQFMRPAAINKMTLKGLDAGESISSITVSADKDLVGFYTIGSETWTGQGDEIDITTAQSVPASGEVVVYFITMPVEDAILTVSVTTGNYVYSKTFTKTISFSNQSVKAFGVNGLTRVDKPNYSGDYVILAKNDNTYYALKGEASSTRIASVNYNGSLSSYSGDASLVWTIAASGDGYTVKNGGNFIGWNGGSGSAANNAALIAEADYDADKCLMGIEANGDTTYKLYVAGDHSRLLARNTSGEYFAFYAGTQYKDLVFVPATSLEPVATPTFSPAAGEVASGTAITISTTTSGATIYYTTDGSTPTTSSTQGNSVTITAATTIKAIAVKDGMANSEVATAQYTITGTTDYSSMYTTGSDVDVAVSSGGTNYHVSISGTSYDAVKANKAAEFTITIPAGTTTLHLFIAAWNGEGHTVTVTGGTINNASIVADSAISGSGTTYTLNGNISDYYRTITPASSETTTIKITLASSKRAVIWGVNAEGGASVTWELESIAVTTPPTKTTYTVGDSFDSTGMVVTGHYVDASDNTNTKDEAVTGYTISPNGALAVTDDHVTITYQGQSTTQAITVNATPSYDFETVAELNGLVTSSSATYSGYLTNAVVSFVPATGTAIVKDATGSVMFYKSNHGLSQGQTYTGAIEVTAIKYNGLYSEVTAWDATFTGAGAVVNPQSVALSALIGHYDDYQNAYVQVAGLTVSSVDGKNIQVTNGANTYVVYDNTNSVSVGAGDVITAVGTITKYSTTEELKVWNAADITVTSSAPKAITFSQPSSGGSFTVSAGGNSISSGDTVASGTTVTLTATPATDYEFTSWTVTGATVTDAAAATTTFTMGTTAVTVSATFSNGGVTPASYTYEFTSQQFSAVGTKVLNNVSWTLSGTPNYFGYDSQNGRGQQFGSKNNPATDAILTTTGISGTISSVKVSAAAYSASATITVSVNGSIWDTKNLSSTNTEYTFTGTPASGSVVITLTNPSSGGRALYIEKIVVN